MHRSSFFGTTINMRSAELAVLAVVAGMLLAGVSAAGSYRRVTEARGTVEYEPDVVVEGLLSNCYNVPLYDFCTGENIGFAYDCLHGPIGAPDCTGGMNLTATTIFTIGASRLTIRGYTSVLPVVVTEAPSAYTHITGSFAPTTPVDGIGILGGTGIFEGATGSVRLSGAVNLGDAPGNITFSCLFVIDVETTGDVDYEYVFQDSSSPASKQQVPLVALMAMLGIAVKVWA